LQEFFGVFFGSKKRWNKKGGAAVLKKVAFFENDVNFAELELFFVWD
jgi:hypothetical protein